MGFIIPNAGGLARELIERVGEERLRLSDPHIIMAPDGIHKVKQCEIFVDDERIGIVSVNSVRPRIVHVYFYGSIPDYFIPGYDVQPKNGRITLFASQRSEPKWTRVDPKDLCQPNNIQGQPLYRYDVHQIRLADYEVAAKLRFIE